MTQVSVLITGGGGFVGSHLAQGFQALGYAVTSMDLSFDAETRTRLAGVRLIEAALAPETLKEALAGGCTMVIHAAALTSPPEMTGLTLFGHVSHNVDLLLDCLDQASAHGVSCFVFLSSSGVFSFDEAEELDEGVTPSGTSAYSVAKRAGEAICSAFAGSLVLRLGPLYGPDERSRPSRVQVSPIRRWLDCVEEGRPITVESPLSRRDWTFLPDLARAIDLLRRQGSSGLLHLTSGEIVADLDLAQRIAALRPGTTVIPAERPEPRRVPMRSRRADLNGFAWTPLARGLHLVAEAHA